MFTVEQKVDAHLQVGNFVWDIIHDILEPFQILLHFQFYAIIETYIFLIRRHFWIS